MSDRPTVLVEHPTISGETMRINEAAYDPAEHTLAEGQAAPDAEPGGPYTVGDPIANGRWWPVIHAETGERVDGESARSKEAAQANADALNADDA